MIKTILKKDLYSNIQDAKIQTLAIAILFFSIVVTLLGVFEYKIKNERYHVEQAANLEQLYKNQVYATLNPKVIKMPTPLAIFNKGVEANFGNSYTFNTLDIPYQADKIYEANAYIESFINLDLSVIFIWFFSLISILLAYDSVVREREDGTLKLMFVSRLSKLDLYISKIIASILSISFVLFMSLLIITAIFLFTSWIEFNLQLCYALLLFFILTLLYSIFWITVAMTCSIIFKSSAQSLIASLTVWILFLIVVPTVVKTIIGNTDYINEKNEITMMHEDIMKNYYDQRQEVLERDFYPLYNNLQFLTLGGNVDGEPIWAPNPATRNAAINYYNTLNPLKRDIADQKFVVADEKYLVLLQKDIRRLGRLSNLSPVMLFERISMQISGTSYEDQFSFLTQFRTYRNQVIDFLMKRNAFGSDRWFTPDDPYIIGHPVCPKDINHPTEEELDKMHDYYNERDAEKWRLDLNDFPVFQVPLSDLMTKNNFLQGFLVMIFIPCVVFAFGLYRMNRYHNF